MSDKTPNKETLAALEEAKVLKPRFSSSEELMDSLEKEISKE